MMDTDLWGLNKTFLANKHRQLIKEAVRREFAFEAIFGNAETDMAEFLSVFNIQLLPTVAIVIQADNAGTACFDHTIIQRQQKDIYSRVLAMLQQDVEGIVTVVGQDNIFAITVGERDIALLLPVDIKRSQAEAGIAAKRYGRHIKAHLSKKMNYSISLGIGQGYEFKNIRQSYFEACAALKYKFYQGDGTVIHYSEVSWGDRASQQIFIDYETKLLSIVRKGEWQHAAVVVAHMLDTIGNTMRVHPDVLKVRVLELLTVISRGIMDLGGDPDTLLDIKIRSGDEIGRVTTLNEMKAWLPALIIEMCALFKEKQQAAIVRAVTNAKQFIAENYQRDISLEDLAKREYLSLSYFSRAFSEVVGTSFTDYLKAVRVTHAQTLLLTTDKGVAEIAARVGYQDPNYFSRVFKKATGKSPQRYRLGE
ncbi:helix-turn-helix transcriptional regulator [Sporomusa termitida]|uniref:HTH-type transcriptional activator RhaR n=1 Tax=Sporomusa termitida TaxID=2377 RepID=A0A517DP48_9FIRM|nr:helix-turn-helix domain-containing protein [Sporomusa termitida]QDR79143.1 HTH-type transcriptional activator RhaR [Sporomusa termitida]